MDYVLQKGIGSYKGRWDIGTVDLICTVPLLSPGQNWGNLCIQWLLSTTRMIFVLSRSLFYTSLEAVQWYCFSSYCTVHKTKIFSLLWCTKWMFFQSIWTKHKSHDCLRLQETWNWWARSLLGLCSLVPKELCIYNNKLPLSKRERIRSNEHEKTGTWHDRRAEGI